MGLFGRQFRKERFFACPHCGAMVRRGAAACPECGSDETTGWADAAGHGDAEIPTGYAKDDGFDYDQFVRHEFGSGRRVGTVPLRTILWWLVCLAVAVVFVLTYVIH